jgi:molecular chaperone DnaK
MSHRLLACPPTRAQVFTTVHDGQTEISVLVLEGEFTQASRCNVLAQCDMVGLPPAPKGVAKIEVAYHVDEHGVLTVTARDLNSQRQEQWLREGLMVAHVAPPAAPGPGPM